MIHAVAFVAAGLASYYTRESSSSWTSIHEPMIDSRHTCATRELVPYHTRLTIINDANGRESWCVVNDYGPQASTGRIIDVSLAVANDLGMVSAGVVRVRIYKRYNLKGSPHANCQRRFCGFLVHCIAPGICRSDVHGRRC